jgi:hypothetical protein
MTTESHQLSIMRNPETSTHPSTAMHLEIVNHPQKSFSLDEDIELSVHFDVIATTEGSWVVKVKRLEEATPIFNSFWGVFFL